MPLNCTRIRDRRERLDLSQKEAARATGIREDVLSRLENGVQANPTLKTLEKLAQGLHLKVADLIIEPRPKNTIY